MIELSLDGAKNILCLGAHSDDIEIGCGATLLKLVRQRQDLTIWWVVFSAEGGRSKEARSSANAFLSGVSKKKIIVKQFRGSYFPADAERIKDYFEEIKKAFRPDLVLTHYRHDRHQDHRVLSDLAWNTFRSHLILEYEIPKYDGDLGAPNTFVRVDEALCRQKVEYLARFFRTQSNKHWFADETFLGLMRLRGMECASPTHYAEAFYSRKIVLT